MVSRIGASRAAELAVVAVVEALEIDFVEIDPRAQVFEHLRRPVAVRHEAGHQPRGPRFLEDGHGPFAGDQRLVVGADDHARPQSRGVSDQPFGRGFERRRGRPRIAQRLRRHPVLAVSAVQIATQHAEAVRQRAGMRVEERLLLDGIALHAADVAPRHAQASAVVETHLADADGPVRQRTAMAARVTAEAAIGKPVVQLALARRLREQLS